MKTYDRIWRLIARKLAGEATTTEIKELDKWFIQYPDFAVYMQLLGKTQQSQNPTPADEFLHSLRKKMATVEEGFTGNYLFEDKFCTRVTFSQRSKMDITFYLFLN